MKDRILPLEGVRNFRDFGGYASRHGGHVKQGRLFRSGHYAEATHGDLQQIRQKRIAVQADLRRPDERERQPGKWSAPMTITHDGGREHEAPHHQFLTKVEADAEKAEAWMTDYYRVAPFKAHHAPRRRRGCMVGAPRGPRQTFPMRTLRRALSILVVREWV